MVFQCACRTYLLSVAIPLLVLFGQSSQLVQAQTQPAPTNLRATSLGNGSVRLDWDYNGPTTGPFVIEIVTPDGSHGAIDDTAPSSTRSWTSDPYTPQTGGYEFYIGSSNTVCHVVIAQNQSDPRQRPSPPSNVACASIKGGSSSSNASDDTPQIYYILPLYYQSFVTSGPQFIVYGANLGNRGPQNGDSSHILVTDLDANQNVKWNAGCNRQDLASCNPANDIGLQIIDWTDSQIVILGFTGSDMSSRIAVGDTIRVTVWSDSGSSDMSTAPVVDHFPWDQNIPEITGAAFGCLKDLGVLAGTGGKIASLTITAGQITGDMVQPDSNPLKQDLKVIQDLNPAQGVIDCVNVYQFLSS